MSIGWETLELRHSLVLMAKPMLKSMVCVLSLQPLDISVHGMLLSGTFSLITHTLTEALKDDTHSTRTADQQHGQTKPELPSANG